jgi:hypothetical protein
MALKNEKPRIGSAQRVNRFAHRESWGVESVPSLAKERTFLPPTEAGIRFASLTVTHTHIIGFQCTAPPVKYSTPYEYNLTLFALIVETRLLVILYCLA